MLQLEAVTNVYPAPLKLVFWLPGFNTEATIPLVMIVDVRTHTQLATFGQSIQTELPARHSSHGCPVPPLTQSLRQLYLSVRPRSEVTVGSSYTPPFPLPSPRACKMRTHSEFQTILSVSANAHHLHFCFCFWTWLFFCASSLVRIILGLRTGFSYEKMLFGTNIPTACW